MVSSTTWGALRGSIAYPQRDAGIVDVTPMQINVYGVLRKTEIVYF